MSRLSRAPVERTAGTKLTASEPTEQLIDGSVRTAPRDVRDLQRLPPVADIIIEFREPAPMAAAGTSGVRRMRSDALRARAEALPTRVQELGRDLARLHGVARNTRRATISTSVDEAPQVTHTYSRVLFGAGVRANREMLAAIKALPYVADARLARTFKTMLAESGEQIHTKQTWAARGTRGKGIVVAVIDTGVDYTHAALGGGFGAGFKVIGGYDFYNDDADPIDDNGHGTHVAGIIAANDGAALTGVAPEASILAYKVLNATGGGSETKVIAAVERVVDPNQDGDTSDHADIVNMSLGGPAADDDLVVKAVQNASAAGVTFCIASGNDGEYGNLPSPAIAPSAITVGAVDSADRIANFSNRGPTLEFGLKPEIVAPGVGISSTYTGGETESLSGTSMATPHVAGVAALIKSLHREWTADEIKSAMVGTASPLLTDVMDQGGGRVDALLATAPSTLSTPVTIDFGQVGSAETWTSSRQVTLRNITALPQTLNASVAGERDGIGVTVTPSTVSLAPGESRTVTFDLTFSNKLVPAPQEGSLSFGGFVTWSGGSAPFHLAWSCVKAAFITIDVVNNKWWVSAEIMGDHKKWGTLDFGERFRKLWRLEPVDIAIFEDRRMAGDFPVHVAFAENVNITAEGGHVTIDMNEANNTFDTAGTAGPDGKPLTAGRGCMDEAIMAFPGGKKFGFGQVSVENEVARDMHNFHVQWGRLSERVKVYITTTCSDVASKALFVAAHDRLDGLSGNVKTTMHQQWSSQPVRFVPEANGSKGLTVAYARLLFPADGNVENFYGGAAEGHLMRSITPDLTLHFTRPAEPGLSIITNLERYGQCESGPECTLIDNVWIYPRAEGTVVDSDLYLEISPMAYRARPDRPVVVGDTPLFPSAGFSSGGGIWRTGVTWKGSLGEVRSLEASQTHIAAWDFGDTLLAEGTGSILRNAMLPKGRYRMEGTLSNVLVGGRPARAVVAVSVDTSKPDSFAPRFTGIRVENENHEQTSIVRPQSHSSLLFSIADDHADEGHIRRRPTREEATRIDYRPHGTTDWRPLPALAMARHYLNNDFLSAGVGTMYRLDLASVTASNPGPIDLRFHIEDEAGNTADYTLSPAFVVEAEVKSLLPRRRGVLR